jgi:hypothetical protein
MLFRQVTQIICGIFVWIMVTQRPDFDAGCGCATTTTVPCIHSCLLVYFKQSIDTVGLIPRFFTHQFQDDLVSFFVCLRGIDRTPV